jgi:histone acetyltransferase MYST1
LQHLEKEHQEKTKVKNIQAVELGRHEMDTWYYSPYPEPHASCQKLYLCEYTLKVGSTNSAVHSAVPAAYS